MDLKMFGRLLALDPGARGVGAASSEKVEQWFAELDSDGDGGIDSAEFARLGEVVHRHDELR
eukprot:COSAG04_NODE_103_length_26181_cov_19.804616_14_plen_62_part_00